MTPLGADRLYELLPAVHRLEDARRDYVLEAFLEVIQEQADLVADDILRLYDNWFIETCEDWVAPFLGDLVGRTLAGPPLPREVGRLSPLRTRLLHPRTEIANVVRFRRRKGTLPVLEELARDVAGWPARAVEFARLVMAAQAINHLRLDRGRTIDVRRGETVRRIDTPFDQSAHTVDVRRLKSPLTSGRYNPQSVALFVWRLSSFPLTKATSACTTPGLYTFDPLGEERQLFVRQIAETDPHALAEETNLPVPLTRSALEDRRDEGESQRRCADLRFYGPEKSLAIWTVGWQDDKSKWRLVPHEQIIPADLRSDRCRPAAGFVAVDPQRGKIAFAEGQHPRQVRASYHYGFSAEMGGGEYSRTLTPPRFADHVVRENPAGVIRRACADLKQLGADARRERIVEFADSRSYSLMGLFPFDVPENATLILRAASGARPVLFLGTSPDRCGESFLATMHSGSKLVFDGLVIHGGAIAIEFDREHAHPAPADDAGAGALELHRPPAVELRHCTLVPPAPHDDCCGQCGQRTPSITLRTAEIRLRIEKSILGPIQAAQPFRGEEAKGECPLAASEIELYDSILDAGGESHFALSAFDGVFAFTRLTAVRTTTHGRVRTHTIGLAEDGIFTAKLETLRRRSGCIRFCHVPLGSDTPGRFQCQPDLAIEGNRTACGKLQKPKNDEERQQIAGRVRPRFTSRCYGDAAYFQLSRDCPREITRGAEDGSEMGAFHDLYQPQREDQLADRLEEFTPAALESQLIFVT
jgi:hypothetical protein